MEFVLAIGAVVALFWTAVVMFRGGLVGGALLVLVAGTCFGHPFFKIAAGPLPITSDRILLAVLAAQYLLYWHWGWTNPKPLQRADYLLAALLVALTISTLAHDFRYRNALPLAQLAFLYCMPVAIYWIARQSRWTERNTMWMFGVLAVLAIYLAFTAVAETHGVWSVVFPRYVASPEFKEFYGRGRGPLLNPAGNGLLQALGLCAALMWWPRLNRVGQLMLLGLVPLVLYGVYSTYTRSAWMGAAGALAIIVALSTPRGWRMPVVSLGILASVLLLAVTWQQFLSFKRDKELSAEEAAESAKLRPILAMVAWHMFLDRPLLGCGYGQYEQESKAYLSDRTTDLPLEKARPFVQHNVFLGLLTETGLVGMGLFIALLASWTHTAWRLWRAASAPLWVRQVGLLFLGFMGSYLANGMFQDVSLIPMVNMYLFFLGGAVTGLMPWLVSHPSARQLQLWRPEAEAELITH